MPQFNEGNINSYLVPSGSLTGSLSNSGTLTGQIAIGSGGGTSDYNDLTNKPSINSVTLSGNKTTSDLNISYNDLDDKPTIPAAQVNSDWNASSGVAEILNKPTIPTEIDDLSDVDTTGVFNGAVLTYIANDDKWEAFSVPQQLPPPVESLQNVIETTPEYAGQVLKLSHGAPVTKWTNDYVSYNELTDRPTIPDPQVNSDWNAASGVAEILNKPTLATVATSGSYNDLTDKPTIPTVCSISRGSSMPSTFPVPGISRRGNTVVIRFAVLLPAGSYTTSDVLWNYAPLMADFPALTFPVYGSGEINLLKILPDGTIVMNSNKTFAADTWLIGEATFLTDG